MPSPGQILGGKYRLERLVGSGGFASVWAARNVMLDRLVALKILSENYARMPGFLPRFLREAKLASRAIHKNIVAVEDIDQTPDGLVFLVMELLQGHTLADELKGGKSLTLERTLEIMIPTLEGLEAAHARNIIHRDIKPANIFLTDPGTPGPDVRILDLGLAKDLVSDDELTSTDQMVGTPSYLAPEMFLGPQTRNWAPTADVFACGMLMFRMLAGGLPFDRSVAGLPPIEQFLARAEFYQTIGEMPGPAQYVPSIPDGIDSVVRKAISLKLDERYRSAGEMLEALVRSTSGAYRGAADSRPSGGDPSDDRISFRDLEDLAGDYDPDDEGDFDDGKTRVDANPWGLEGTLRQLEELDSSNSTTREATPQEIDGGSPAHLQPVAGRTFQGRGSVPVDAFEGRPSTEPTAQGVMSGGQRSPKSVPDTLRPSPDRTSSSVGVPRPEPGEDGTIPGHSGPPPGPALPPGVGPPGRTGSSAAIPAAGGAAPAGRTGSSAAMPPAGGAAPAGRTGSSAAMPAAGGAAPAGRTGSSTGLPAAGWSPQAAPTGSPPTPDGAPAAPGHASTAVPSQPGSGAAHSSMIDLPAQQDPPDGSVPLTLSGAFGLSEDLPDPSPVPGPPQAASAPPRRRSKLFVVLMVLLALVVLALSAFGGLYIIWRLGYIGSRGRSSASFTIPDPRREVVEAREPMILGALLPELDRGATRLVRSPEPRADRPL